MVEFLELPEPDEDSLGPVNGNDLPEEEENILDRVSQGDDVACASHSAFHFHL